MQWRKHRRRCFTPSTRKLMRVIFKDNIDNKSVLISDIRNEIRLGSDNFAKAKIEANCGEEEFVKKIYDLVRSFWRNMK